MDADMIAAHAFMDEREKDPMTETKNVQTKVKLIYQGGYIANLGIVEEGGFKGWLVYRHPDGQWVTLVDLKGEAKGKFSWPCKACGGEHIADEETSNRITELEEEAKEANRSEAAANVRCMAAVQVTHTQQEELAQMATLQTKNAEQKDQIEALTRLVLPSITVAPSPDGRVLLSSGGGRLSATISRVAARAAIRSLKFVIPEWLWSEKDPE
jgi:hypothetical protein